MNNVDAFGTKFANAVMVAAAEILRSQGKTQSVDVDALVSALKTEAAVGLDNFLRDGKALTDAGRSSWLETLMKTECVDAARRAVAAVA